MKLIITLVLLGGAMKLPVQEHFYLYRDAYCIFILLLNLIFPFGNLYGIVILVSFVLFCIFSYIQNLITLINKEKNLEELNDDINKYLILITEQSDEIKYLKNLNAKLLDEKEYMYSSVQTIVFRLHNEISEENLIAHRLDKDILSLENYLQRPLTVTKEISLFNVPKNKKIAKRQIKYLKEILDQYKLGPVFDKQLIKEIKRLEALCQDVDDNRINN